MKKFFPTLITGIFFLILSSFLFSADGASAGRLDTRGKACTDCHAVTAGKAHEGVSCGSCHKADERHYAKAADFASGAAGCISCHDGAEGMLNSPMHTRTAEKQFVHESYGKKDPDFFDKNCSSCHLASCSDCHGGKSVHETVIPDTEKCVTCHSGYYTGIEYMGLGVREDHERYGRGVEHNGEFYSQMLPDVHYEKGLQCADCHSMESLTEGKPFSKACTDCHEPDRSSSVEHSIPEHMEKMECYACHSSWVSQEYGTFWIRFKDSFNARYFSGVQTPNSEYAKSSHTKTLTLPPLGINDRGKYSPVRPQYIAFFTYVEGRDAAGKENEMLANNFKALFPHTIRREVVMCESCHKNNQRLLRETEDERIFDLKKDGLEIESFFNSKEFKVTNGRFISNWEYRIITDDDLRYKRLSIKKWEQIRELIDNPK